MNEQMIDTVMPTQLQESKIKEVQKMDVAFKSIINYMNNKDIKSHLDFTMNPQAILFKMMKDHGKMFDAVTVPKLLQKYILSERHNDSARGYQFIKRQHYWKGLKKAAQDCETLLTASVY